MTSKLTRERLEKIKSWRETYGAGSNVMLPAEEAEELASIALAAMDSEPVAWTWQHLKQWHVTNDEARARDLAWDGVKVEPLYRHAQQAPECEQLAIENFRSAMEGIGHIRRTLEETFGGLHGTHVEPDVLAECKAICDAIYAAYGHAQPAPVVPDDVLAALQKVARIRLDMNDFDGDRRGIADCLCDAEEALIEVVNRRAAMLAAAPQPPGSDSAPVPGKWIPVSEQKPENKPGSYEYLVFETLNNRVNHDYWNVPSEGDDAFTPFWNHYGEHVTHWMSLPAAPQEVKGE